MPTLGIFSCNSFDISATNSFKSLDNDQSLVREIGLDREMVEKHPENARKIARHSNITGAKYRSSFTPNYPKNTFLNFF